MTRSLGHALSQVVVLETPRPSVIDAPQGAPAAELERELRLSRDEWARAIDDQARLQDAAEAARRVSIAEAEARLAAEEALARANARIAELQAALAAAAARESAEIGSVAFAAIHFVRRCKDRILPHSSARRSLYDKALRSLKKLFGLELRG